MSADLKPGDPVIVRNDVPNGHCRTPHYLRGHRGEIVSILGTFPNPEQIAYYQKGDPLVLYEVRFASAEVWGDYAGSPKDSILADIYDHWLEPAHG
ncbi:MAG: nitrile hydratase subunit beta [Alphaproteobacteria bacterium]|nr:nitrile hydratase subunit beta [Alphaproteobacteria bacterium]MCB9929552.1 nitrile hydratase subunit beta [Alphaproteobacteria bacterium]